LFADEACQTLLPTPQYAQRPMAAELLLFLLYAN
jgi:hypothetical protein